MSGYARPTLRELITRAETDFDTSLPGADSRLRRSVLSVLARIHAGALHLLYAFLDWIARQRLPDTADAEELDRHASLRGLARKGAVAASGNVTLAGVDGSIVPAGTQLARGDAVAYATAAQAVVAAGAATVAVTAVVGGAAGDAVAGVRLRFLAPVVGVQSEATVAAGGLSGGADSESDEQLRDRIVADWRAPPQGGALHDYVRWAREIAGVTRAWARAGWQGPGTMGVLFVYDDRVSPWPTGPEVTAMQAHLDARRPATVPVYAVAPTAVPMAMTVLLSPNTAAVQAAVSAELADLIRRAAEPGGTIRLSHLREAVSAAAGESDNAVTVPAADVTHASHEMASLGVVTFGAL